MGADLPAEVWPSGELGAWDLVSHGSEEFFWEPTNTIVIGGGNIVYFFDIHGALRTEIPVPSLFGHFELAAIPTATGSTEELLFILGWTDVHVIDSQLETR